MAKKKSSPLLTVIAILVIGFIAWTEFGGDFELFPKNTLTVLAGSELKDIEPLLDDIADETGVRLEMHYTGTLDGAEQLMNGRQVDLAWFSHAKYLTLLQGPNKKVPQEKIMLSPVVLGVKASKARAWGWADNANLTWRDIAAKAGGGELRFGMTNPASSNSGFSALMGVVAALSPDPEAFDAAPGDLKAFFSGRALASGSSGWLAEAYVREQAALDGLINYESVLLQLNDSGQLREKLVLIYPQEGIVTADYPLMLMNPAKREDFDKLVAFLRTPEMQQRLMADTHRRPVIPQVQPAPVFGDRILVELPFPRSVEVVDRILFTFLDELSIPSHAVFVLDVSGSMQGKRLDQLKSAMNNLAGLDNSITGRFARFRGREQVTLVTFNNKVRVGDTVEIRDTDANAAEMQQIRQQVANLHADGGTAIYDALQQAFNLIEGFQTQDVSPRHFSVVLMSDGQSNHGTRLTDFESFHGRISDPALMDVRVFPILFGDANVQEMHKLAEMTGGRVFDANKHSLNSVFKKIRGYQ